MLADFLEEGHLESHLRRMRSHYDSRRTFLIETLHQHFGESVTISGDEAGMYLLATFCTHLSEDEAWQRAFAAGVRPERIYWPCGVSRTPSGFARFVIAYASLTEEEIDGAWSGKYPLTIDRQSEYVFTVPDSVVIIAF